MIKEFTKYIETNVASLSMSGTGRNLYAGHRPQSAPAISTVVETPFPDRTSPILSDQVERTFRIECRGEMDNYFSADDVARSIHDALHGVYQVTLQIGTGTKYLVNIAATEPSSIGPDDKHRPRVVIYLYVNKEEIP